MTGTVQIKKGRPNYYIVLEPLPAINCSVLAVFLHDCLKKAKYTGANHYNENQIVQLLDYFKGDPLEIVILLTIFYGLRRSEVLVHTSVNAFTNQKMNNHAIVGMT